MLAQRSAWEEITVECEKSVQWNAASDVSNATGLWDGGPTSIEGGSSRRRQRSEHKKRRESI